MLFGDLFIEEFFLFVKFDPFIMDNSQFIIDNSQFTIVTIQVTDGFLMSDRWFLNG